MCPLGHNKLMLLIWTPQACWKWKLSLCMCVHLCGNGKHEFCCCWEFRESSSYFSSYRTLTLASLHFLPIIKSQHHSFSLGKQKLRLPLLIILHQPLHPIIYQVLLILLSEFLSEFTFLQLSRLSPSRVSSLLDYWNRFPTGLPSDTV